MAGVWKKEIPSSLGIHLKKLGKEQQIILNESRWKVIKIKTEFN